MPTNGIMIGIGQENARFARALQDEFLRKRLMVDYARRSKVCLWAAVSQVGIAFGFSLLPSTQNARYVFLCIGLGFLVLCVRSRHDLKLLKLAERQLRDETPSTQCPHSVAGPAVETQADVKSVTTVIARRNG